ncbi:hypothetical protein U5801_21360 [Lamprobacter modestohalophilus]|uniref:hypothetical protein n=1 Tax=Lamprobacter modestohalophilus TaxID=1064514 RepID=UPI002ADEE111|nr:hypothetical protein [Lamprobacter modestohalophilus]MEA1052333.1 hypothetical protein [Lamprobacter modestohalophilus]
MVLSQRAYAQHRGVSHEAVRKAIKSGRITPLPDGRIDPVVADAQWDANTLPAQTPAKSESSAPASDSTQRSNVPPYAVSRAAREAINARLAKLELEERSGKLINADEARVTTFNLARQLRDRLQQIPRTLAPELVATVVADPDPRAVEAMLDAAIRSALEELSQTPL